jgi:glyceraldehyde 3-phosphate dehydrogenase
MINVAINGFGRIGRATFKVLLDKKNIKIVAVNDLTDTKTLAYLLQYDSCYGKYNKKISSTENSLIIGDKKFKILAEKDPSKLPWKELKVDIVIESTGRFTKKEDAKLHIQAGAKKVIISAPAKRGDVKTFVLGVNEDKITKKEEILSMASCTTNCLAPITNIIRKRFGIKKALMTTIHSYTADQNLVDGPHKDLRRARSAALSMIPTTTGAAIAVTEAIPQLVGKFDGMAVRVPTPVGSISDLVYLLDKKTTAEEVNAVLEKEIKQDKYKGIVEASWEPLVSIDIVGNPHSAIIDLSLTKIVDGDLLKIIAWYDNEWGYSNRLADLCDYFDKKKLI